MPSSPAMADRRHGRSNMRRRRRRRQGRRHIADSGNHRIRRITREDQADHTVAGSGAAEGEDTATARRPRPRCSSGRAGRCHASERRSSFVADTGHNRVRKIDAVNGNMTTVAGNGTAGLAGDGGPATAASLRHRPGLALVASNRSRLTITSPTAPMAASALSGRTGSSALTGANAPVFGTPARLAFHPRGWLYVADATRIRSRRSRSRMAVHRRRRRRLRPSPRRFVASRLAGG